MARAPAQSDACASGLPSEAVDCALYHALPQGVALLRYIAHGYPPNHFLRAVVENDLMEALARADDENFEALEAYCAWLKTYAPAAAYGSSDKVAAWIAARGTRSDGDGAA